LRQLIWYFMTCRCQVCDGVATHPKLRQAWKPPVCQTCRHYCTDRAAMSDGARAVGAAGIRGYMPKPVSSRNCWTPVQATHRIDILRRRRRRRSKLRKCRDSARALRPSSRRMPRECNQLLRKACAWQPAKADLGRRVAQHAAGTDNTHR